MPITEKEFKKYLMLYGTEIKNWPEALQTEAMRVKYRPALNRLIIEQQYCDEALLNNRYFEPENPYLADRIINAARTVAKPSDLSFAAWVQELLAALLPQPAFALATVLTLGIAIGLFLPASTLPTSDNNTITQVYFEDDGVIL